MSTLDKSEQVLDRGLSTGQGKKPITSREIHEVFTPKRNKVTLKHMIQGINTDLSQASMNLSNADNFYNQDSGYLNSSVVSAKDRKMFTFQTIDTA